MRGAEEDAEEEAILSQLLAQESFYKFANILLTELLGIEVKEEQLNQFDKRRRFCSSPSARFLLATPPTSGTS